jgi:hypothetical protein
MSCTDAVRYAKDRGLYYSGVDDWCAVCLCHDGRYGLERLPTAWTNNLLCRRAFLLLYRYIRDDEACVSNVISASIGKFANLHLLLCKRRESSFALGAHTPITHYS